MQKQASTNLEESKDSVNMSSYDTSSIGFKKQELKDKMGADVFNYYYGYLTQKRQDPSTDEAKLRSQLNEWIGTNKTLKNLIFELEQVIFKEI